MTPCWDCPHHHRELMLTTTGRPLCFISWCCDAYQATTPPGVHKLQRDGAVAARESHKLEVAGSSPAPASHKKPAVLAGLCAGDSRLITTQPCEE
jgi:hypothetical protein